METTLDTKQVDNEIRSLIGRRLIIADFKEWSMAVLDPIYGRVEPAIGDYLKYYRAYLFFYSEGSPKARLSRNSAYLFLSRLWQLSKRLFTNSLKPAQLWAESSTEKATTPRSLNCTETP